MNFNTLPFILSHFLSYVYGYPTTLLRYRGSRDDKQCIEGIDHLSGYNLNPFYRRSVLENPFYLFLIIILAIFILLLLSGLIKAIIGIYSKTIGEFGMGLLVDLPKPLDEYQEKDLKKISVEYDVGGWPIHPFRKTRTVRVLSRNTEFCLNVVFFLAYPMALIFQLCTFCCCIKRYSDEDDEKKCFTKVNVIKFNEELKKKIGNPGPNLDVYKENDGKEMRDTNYVINQMQISQSSLHRK